GGDLSRPSRLRVSPSRCAGELRFEGGKPNEFWFGAFGGFGGSNLFDTSAAGGGGEEDGEAGLARGAAVELDGEEAIGGAAARESAGGLVPDAGGDRDVAGGGASGGSRLARGLLGDPEGGGEPLRVGEADHRARPGIDVGADLAAARDRALDQLVAEASGAQSGGWRGGGRHRGGEQPAGGGELGGARRDRRPSVDDGDERARRLAVAAGELGERGGIRQKAAVLRDRQRDAIRCARCVLAGALRRQDGRRDRLGQSVLRLDRWAILADRGDGRLRRRSERGCLGGP